VVRRANNEAISPASDAPGGVLILAERAKCGCG
jgi:hypothetical protein